MESKLRIPRVATAVLVLGGACGDDEKKDNGAHLDTSGTDTSGERRQTVAAELCKLLIECEGGNTSLQPTCERNTTFDLDRYAATGTEDCTDARLDYYACYASLTCSELDDEDSDAVDECVTKTRFEERCEGELDDDETPP